MVLLEWTVGRTRLRLDYSFFWILTFAAWAQNYLLWQVAYSEFYVTDTYWPDFDRWGLVDAILAYQGRDRRFGGLSKTEEA